MEDVAREERERKMRKKGKRCLGVGEGEEEKRVATETLTEIGDAQEKLNRERKRRKCWHSTNHCPFSTRTNLGQGLCQMSLDAGAARLDGVGQENVAFFALRRNGRGYKQALAYPSSSHTLHDVTPTFIA